VLGKRPPKLSDAELLTIAVAQALPGVRSEARRLRFLPRHLPGAFPYLPGQSGYNKRLRGALPLFKKVIWLIAADTDLWFDDVGVTTPPPSNAADPGPPRNAPTWPAGPATAIAPHTGEHLLKPVRQLIASVNDTLKGQLDLEPHGGRSIEGVGARIAQRLLAMTATIWHNRATGQPLTRSLIAYDH
jgi:hypothetical protein